MAAGAELSAAEEDGAEDDGAEEDGAEDDGVGEVATEGQRSRCGTPWRWGWSRGTGLERLVASSGAGTRTPKRRIKTSHVTYYITPERCAEQTIIGGWKGGPPGCWVGSGEPIG